MEHRGEFSSRIGFVIAAAGSAVGLGNIWGFPVMVSQNGGAAFVFVYLVFVFALCFPVLMMEIAIGRRTARNPVGAFKQLAPGRSWYFVGGMGVLAGVMILSFYIVLAGWVLGYFVECLLGGLERLASDGEQARFAASWQKSLLYMGFFMLATVSIVVGGIRDGIERWSRYLMPALLTMMLLLIIYILTLPNAMKGLSFYLVPDFSRLDAQVINSALSQAFFSLSLGMGALITYGSYVSKRENIASSSLVVAGADSAIALGAGMLVIPAVFTLAPDTTSETMPSGPGLIFVFLPKVFMNLSADVGYLFASFLASFFFLLIAFAALTSTISLLEVPTSYLVDERGFSRKKAAFTTAGIVGLIGIGSLLSNGAVGFFTNFVAYPADSAARSFMTVVGDIFFQTALPVGGLFISLFAAIVWRSGLKEEISRGFPGYPQSALASYMGTVLFILPLIFLLILISSVLSMFFGIQIF